MKLIKVYEKRRVGRILYNFHLLFPQMMPGSDPVAFKNREFVGLGRPART